MSKHTPAARPDLAPKGAYCQLDNLLASRFLAQELSLGGKSPSRSLLAGNVRTRYRGRGMDFEEVRLYQPGDDIRSIDWRVTARTQVPHTKLYREERERPLLLAIDQRASMFFGSRQCFKSVLACHIASTLGWAAVNQGDRLGGVIFSDVHARDLRPGRSKHAQLELIHQLLAFNSQLTSPLPAANAIPLAERLGDLRRLCKPGSALFIISDFHDMNEACERELFMLSRHADVTLIHLYDPLEQHLGGKQPLAISNGTTQVQLPVNQRAFQQAYSGLFAEHLAGLTLTAQRLGIALLSIATHSDSAQALRQAFGRRRQ